MIDRMYIYRFFIEIFFLKILNNNSINFIKFKMFFMNINMYIYKIMYFNKY